MSKETQQKKSKPQQKKQAAGKKGGAKAAIDKVIESSSDDDFDSSSPPVQQQTGGEVTSVQQNYNEQNIGRQAQQTTTATDSHYMSQTAEQLSCTGGKYKFPSIPLNLNGLTMEQIRKLQTDINMEDQIMRKVTGLKEQYLHCQVTWVEEGRPEEGQYILAFVSKKDDFYLEFVYALDQHECVKYLNREDFQSLWRGKYWREELKTNIRDSNNVSKWLKSMDWRGL
eukprot:TRINITY_DN9335_c0_g2_i3.p1 TRINITY_DN9335_c0_g2~~TRINITY_DN9335_c0_g2_i3.p1  ORF type:complete len:257 (+),score=34.24 TRINITY_DN9335_c0_g2_i3:95-772(+)